MAKRRARRRLEAQRRKRAAERAAAENAELIARTSRELEEPRADADLHGDHYHYLQRLERLDRREQGLALRLYYDYSRRRYIARAALGLKVWLVDGETDAVDPKSYSVAIALEPGSCPAHLIMDGRGKVKTLLDAHMAPVVDRRVSFDDFQTLCESFDQLQSRFRSSRESVGEVDLVRLCQDIHRLGWLAPFETLLPILYLGPATGPVLRRQLDLAIDRYAKVFRPAFLPGARTDDDLRQWWTASGALAAFLSLLADLGVEPDFTKLRKLLSVPDLVVALVVGASVAFWRETRGSKVRAAELGPGPDINHSAFQWVMLSIFAVARRRRLQRPDATPGDELPNSFVEGLYEGSARELHERRLLGLPQEPAFVIMRDLAVLARGGSPDWGDDLVDDVHEAPPLLLQDLCRPDGSLTFAGLRYLLQRILAVENSLTSCLFATEAELEQWRERLGPLDEPRRGIFRLPWIHYPEAPPPRSSLPGRNEPCPCGSGKKFKKCCWLKMRDGKK